MIVFDAELTMLSPLHIGEGETLRKGFDFAVHKGRTYRLNIDTLLEAKTAKLAVDRQGHYPPPADLLEEGDYNQPGFFRYVIPGIPRSTKTFAEVQSIIKDVHDRPYIPGSSLKGALRTALGWAGWEEANIKLDPHSLHRNSKRAAQSIERELFGPDPKKDLLRALRISDFHGSKKSGEGLILVNAQVLTQKALGSPIELEAIRGDRVFQGSITFDDTLLRGENARRLGFAKHSHWIEELVLRVNRHTQNRLDNLIGWFEKVSGGERIASFLKQLIDLKLPQDSGLLQLGWGTGWDSKTFGSHLTQNQQQLTAIVERYSLDRAGRGRRGKVKEFPSSRRVVMRSDRVVAPFGWCLLKLNRRT